MRRLNHIEQAFTYSNEVNPLCVVIVLRLQNGPDEATFRSALVELQRRHVLLQCNVTRESGRYSFQKMEPVEPIPLLHVDRKSPDHWEHIVEQELNTRFDSAGPLIRALHLTDETDRSELVLVLHHAVMDGTSARLLLHELLHLSNHKPLPPPLPETVQVAPHGFPPGYRGGALGRKIVPFLAKQMWAEFVFARRGISATTATSPHNRILHLCVPSNVLRRVNLRIGREGLTLNSVINAALLLAVRKVLHSDDRKSLMRAISFTDLRSNLHPPPSESVLGCMISMLRVSLRVGKGDSLLDVAGRLRRGVFAGGRSEEPYLMAALAKYMTRFALKMGRTRIANSAVSFLGKLDLEHEYELTVLVDVHAFITNNVVGPELSGFGKVLFGRLELDLTYLSSEIPESTARELLSEIEVSLTSIAG